MNQAHAAQPEANPCAGSKDRYCPCRPSSEIPSSTVSTLVRVHSFLLLCSECKPMTNLDGHSPILKYLEEECHNQPHATHRDPNQRNPEHHQSHHGQRPRTASAQ